MWDGANPQSSARRRRCFGCRASPFGAALYSRLSAAREARGRSSPSRVTIADAFLSPPTRRPAGGMARPPAKPTSRSALHESPRFHPPRQQARRRARQARPRRNRRRHRPQEPRPRQSVRLRDPTDAAARNDVIERFRAKYEADLKCDGPMSAATEALAERVRKGERLVACAGVGRSVATAPSSSTRSNGASNEALDNARPQGGRRSSSFSRPALSSPNVAAEMDQAAALQARGKSPERTLVGP